MLASKYLRDGQSPQDFHLEFESAALSGQWDYTSLGDVSELVRRTFMAGLPPYLQSSLASLNQSNMEDLVAAAQRVWAVWQRARQPSNTRYGTRPERSVQFSVLHQIMAVLMWQLLLVPVLPPTAIIIVPKDIGHQTVT